MVSVIAIEHMFRGLKPGQSDGFLKVIKVRSTPFFGGKVKP
jgi:hypothetical protein